jgi:hypothetical protein
MNQVDIQLAPSFSSGTTPNEKWQREYEAFRRLLPSLMKDFRDQYVAIHNGQNVAHGKDQIEVAMQAYQQHGYVPMYVGLVTEQPAPVYRIPSPRKYANPRDRDAI